MRRRGIARARAQLQSPGWDAACPAVVLLHDVKQPTPPPSATQRISFPRCIVPPGSRIPFASIPLEGWAERRQAHLSCRVCETRLIRAARPMTRDARLSALHRGDFRPGAALPSPALPPDPCSEAPRSQVIMPGGRCPGPPESAVTSRGRRTPLPAPPSTLTSYCNKMIF